MEIFSFTFMQNALIAGIIIGTIAPCIGIFLVLRRYALIADTLAHVSLAGIAAGLIAGLPPLWTALGVTMLASLGIDRLRSSRTLSGEVALALFLSGALAIAIILLSLGGSASGRVMQYLFGSIVTVTRTDIALMFPLAALVLGALWYTRHSMITITFDETFARVMGIRVGALNTLLILLAAVTITLAIPTLGILLVSALLVIPVVTALQFGKRFGTTLIYAEIISVFSVVTGIIASYYMDLATSGTIVLIMIAIFALTLFVRSGK